MKFIVLLFLTATHLHLGRSSVIVDKSSESTEATTDDPTEQFSNSTSDESEEEELPWDRERWIDVPLDHFNLFDNRTWKMRYFVNEEFFQEGKPMFIEIGGEWTVRPAVLTYGQLSLLAEKHNGLLVATEHRYYGKSLPFEFNIFDLSLEKLKYLQIEQALEDLAYFIEHFKSTTPGLKDSKVIVHGCSYGGMLAQWLRLRFPNTVDIAYASGAPSGVSLGYAGFYETINDVYANVSVSCIDTIRDGFNQTEKLLKTNDGRKALETAFKGWKCVDILNDKSDTILWKMMNILNVQHDPLQFEKVGCVALSMNSDELSAVQQLANFIVLKSKFNNICDDMSEMTAETGRKILAWGYQMCTELGVFPTLARENSRHPFGLKRTIEDALKHCRRINDNITEYLIRTGIERVNRRYGGKHRKATKLVSVQGTADPWKLLGELEGSNPDAPLIFVEGSHCIDSRKANAEFDSDELIQAREDIRNIISRWIEEVSDNVN